MKFSIRSSTFLRAGRSVGWSSRRSSRCAAWLRQLGSTLKILAISDARSEVYRDPAYAIQLLASTRGRSLPGPLTSVGLSPRAMATCSIIREASMRRGVC